jgi:succinate dehydrogenase/fumarate reductase flavoprotein subunit
MPIQTTPLDVVVVGAGNAALIAHAAGATVALLEVAPIEARAGNSAFTGGAFRFVHHGVDDLRARAPDIAELDLATIDFATRTDAQYVDDIGRLTEYRCDPELTEVLIGNSSDAALWLKQHLVRFQPALGRQAFKVDGKFKFGGGPACHILGGGAHLTRTLHEAPERAGIPVHYETMAIALLYDDAARTASACASTTWCTALRRNPWCPPAAGSNPMRNGVPATWGPTTTWRRCAAPASTWAGATAWRSISVLPPPATGPAHTPCSGT